MDRECEPNRQAEDEQGAVAPQPEEKVIPVYTAATKHYDKPLFPSYTSHTGKEPEQPKEAPRRKEVQLKKNENEELKTAQVEAEPKQVTKGHQTWKFENRAKYPKFESFNSRKQSFDDRYKQEEIEDLAKNGFFLEDDNIQCFFCGASSTTDGKILDITVKHSMQNRNCQYAHLKFKADYKAIHPNKETGFPIAEKRAFPGVKFERSGTIKYESPEEENRKRKLALTCELCACTNMKDALFCPCGHLVFCMECAENKRLEICPKCNKMIKCTVKTIRTDFSSVKHVP